ARDLFLAVSLILGVVVTGILAGYSSVFIDYVSPLYPLLLLVSVLTASISVGLIIKTRRCFTEWKVVLACCIAFLLGLLPNFYLPIASMTNPPMNWGYPRTVEGFFHVL